jgi:hypothetical protein
VAVVVSAIAFAGVNVRAGELRDFNVAVADAYAHFRAAIFYLRTENVALAAIEIQGMDEKWARLVDRYRDRPPDAFADDPEWRSVLARIAGRIADGRAAAEASDGKAARDSLSPIRGELGELRGRNNVTVFSDCVDELDAAVRALWVYRKSPPDFAAAQAVEEVTARAAIADYLLARCRDRAPTDYRENAEFQRLMESALEAARKLRRAIEGKDRGYLIRSLRELYSYNRMIFLRFG